MSSRRRSNLWNHFETEGDKKAKCHYCSQVLSLPSGNVGNLGRHMRTKHPTVLLVPDRQDAIAPVTNPSAPASASSPGNAAGPSTSSPLNAAPPTPAQRLRVQLQNPQPSMRDFTIKPLAPRRTEKIDNQLVIMIAKEYHPLRLVEEEEFRKFVALLNPSYSLPTRKTLSESLLPKNYEKLREIAKIRIEDASAVCLTTDGWTSINNESFVAVTAHYVSHNETDIHLETILLGCIAYNERHTGENLCEMLKEIIDEWKLTHKITAIASDNAANIVLGVRIGNWRHIACLAHSINRALQAGLQHINPTVIKVKQIVEYFKRSGTALIKLKEITKQLNVPELKLKQEVQTRWNSTYDMLSRIVTVKDAVVATLALLRSDLSLTSEDWQVIEEAIPILKIFYDVTTEVCGEKNVTLSKVAPLYKIMSNFVKGKLRQGSHRSQIQSLLETLDQQLDRRFAHLEAHEMYAEATILDPRFKRRGFKNDRNFETALSALKQKVGRMAPQQQPTIPQQQVAVPQAASSTESIWSDFDREIALLHPENATAAGIVELDRYMQEPMLTRLENPLTWWHHRRNVYPLLFKYMLKRLNLLATSVPCERVFSKAGYTLTDRRSRLTTKKLEQLVFVNTNAHLL